MSGPTSAAPPSGVCLPSLSWGQPGSHGRNAVARNTSRLSEAQRCAWKRAGGRKPFRMTPSDAAASHKSRLSLVIRHQSASKSRPIKFAAR